MLQLEVSQYAQEMLSIESKLLEWSFLKGLSISLEVSYEYLIFHIFPHLFRDTHETAVLANSTTPLDHISFHSPVAFLNAHRFPLSFRFHNSLLRHGIYAVESWRDQVV